MKVITWNVNGVRGLGPARLAQIGAVLDHEAADVVLLQEVAGGGDLPARLKGTLAQVGLEHFHYSGDPLAERKPYGNVIAARGPLRPAESGWAGNAPWPQLLARATVVSDEGELDVISVHAPNGSANGWAKIHTLEALTAAVIESKGKPMVVGGDFNEPVRWIEGEGPRSVAALKKSDGSLTYEGDWTRTDSRSGESETHPRQRWQDAVRHILDDEASTGLRHVHKERRPDDEPTTHVTGRDGRTQRFFDHLLVSTHFRTVDAGYRHDVREDGVSDHSLGWVVVQLR